MARIPPDGVFVPVPTFFKPASKDTIQPAVDVETQVKHSTHLAKSGITGLLLLGSTGEAVHLNRKERQNLIAGVRQGMDAGGFKDYPIMAGILTNSVEDVLEACHDVKDAGAQWAMVLAPGYFGGIATQANIIDWYTLVADHSPLPVLIYNYPGVTNNLTVSPDSYVRLAAHPNIVGCKMSHGNVSHHVQMALDPRIDARAFRVFSGLGQQLGPICMFGAAGVIDGLAAVYPKTVVRLFKLVAQRPITDESLEEMRALQYRVSAAEEFCLATGIIGLHEAIYKELGLGTMEGGRLPLRGELAEGLFDKWKSGDGALKAVSEIEASL